MSLEGLVYDHCPVVLPTGLNGAHLHRWLPQGAGGYRIGQVSGCPGQLALKAFSEVEQGLSNETLLREREEYLKQVVKDSEESLRVATSQFKAGKVDLLSVLQQQGILIGAKANLINIQDQRLQQRVDLYMALGGGFDGVH